jgi:phosphoribosylamine--glycine ligase
VSTDTSNEWPLSTLNLFNYAANSKFVGPRARTTRPKNWIGNPRIIQTKKRMRLGGGRRMRILVIGSGAREHAMLWKLSQSSSVSDLICAPGNGGTGQIATNIQVAINDLDGMLNAVKSHAIDLVVVGPEEPLSLGLADRLREAGIAVCGNSAAATTIESSKSFAKEIMAGAGIPTARSVAVHDVLQGMTALSDFEIPVVIKADGLAAGKGVVVAQSRDEARMVLNTFLEDGALGRAGSTVVIEECLFGQEISIHAFVDGASIYSLAPSCDHKRIFDNDEGPNTGGMGAFAPASIVDAELASVIRTTILEPLANAMTERGTPLQGALYPGLMLTSDGPKVIEFNARLGDPESQVVLPLLDADFAELCLAVATGKLAEFPAPKRVPGAALGVVLASGGYPGPILSGMPISGLDAVPSDVIVFHAGTKQSENGTVVTSGGRVLTVVGRGADLAEARERAYAGVLTISFNGAHYRRDIGVRGL